MSQKGRSIDAEMHFENRKKSTSPIMEIYIFRPCSQVMASDIEMRTEADTLSVCSTLGYFHWVEFLPKWPKR